jgi:hypothetical protein
MAKIKLGQAIAQASGSVGGTVFSHNRFGAYLRNRSIPVQPESTAQINRRNFFGAASANWATLSANARKAWLVWAQNNPIVDSLGDKRIMDGHQAYTMLSTRLRAIPWASPDTPPVLAAPTALLTCTAVISAAAQTIVFTFTPAPLIANNILVVMGAKAPTASVNYIKNLLRRLPTSDAGQATGWTMSGADAILGTFTIGEVVTLRVAQLHLDNGLMSTFFQTRTTVVA